MSILSPQKRSYFTQLFSEFAQTYPETPDGRRHIASYPAMRAQARKNFELITAAADRGEDITDAVLHKLLPYADTENNRQKGAWVHIAPTVNGDIKKWYEKSGWTDPEDWPKIARAILDFARHCVEDPSQLADACQTFDQLPYSKGFQSGTLSPILNALRPDDFALINNKSRDAINYFSDSAVGQSLVDYPDANRLAHQLVDALEDRLVLEAAPDLRSADVFDMFSHWLRAVRKFDFSNSTTQDEALNQIKEDADEPYAASELAPPFGHFFRDRDEAEWAFNLLAYALQQLGIDDLEDEMFVTSLPGSRFIRLLYGNWVVIGFRRSKAETEIILFAEKADQYQKFKIFDYQQKDEEPSVALYAIPNQLLREQQAPIMENFNRVCALVVERFGYWNASNLRNVHRAAIAEAAFDPEKRARLLRTGLPDREESATGLVHPESAFTEETFDLLAQIDDEPTLDFYQAHKDAFVKYIEEPFKRIMYTVAERLPTSIIQLMETKKNLFGRFPKNDFGQGGAWPHYWGAFYPEGSKRSGGAQLLVSVKAPFLKSGFSIGHYGSEQRRRFELNCTRYLDSLTYLLGDVASDEHSIFGRQNEYQVEPDGAVVNLATRAYTLQDFLRNPSAVNCELFYVIPRHEVLQMSEEELVETVRRTLVRLFPLVLLATKDDPLPAIEAYYEEIGLQIEANAKDAAPEPTPYTYEAFLAETYLAKDRARELREMALDKQQLIFYGPPGTGKSYVAQRLARWLTEQAEPSTQRVEMVQFHPAYGYEDFIEGIRPESKPTGDGRHFVNYPTRPGRFVQFCRTAAENPNEKHVFIIDEINRGNIARIFGELMLLLEYRDQSVPLPYSGERFTIPPNVYLIGTMNTADRSIALVDFALRRRFHFAHFGADPDLFGRWLADHDVELPYLEDLYRRLATEAIDDPNFAIGPSYFMVPKLTEGKLERIWHYSVEPYLEEYYIDQPDKVDPWRWDGDFVRTLRERL